MRNLAVLPCVLLLAACGQGDRDASSDAGRLPAPPPSVVFGPTDAPTGGTLVVGLLVPTPPSHRLLDRIPQERREAFLAAEAARVAAGVVDRVWEAAEEVEEVDERILCGPEGPALGELRPELRRAAAAVEEATSVRVLFRDVLASECGAVPVLLASERVVQEADREALRPWLAAGGRLFVDVGFEHDFGESRPGVLPSGKESIGVLVETCREMLSTSTGLVRLPEDPRDVLVASREGDDVVVSFREPPTRVDVRDIEDVRVVEADVLPDGRVRFRAPDEGKSPYFHRLVAAWEGEGWTMRRAWRIVDLVGTAERLVYAPGLVEAGAPFAPRVLFLNSLTGAPVPGREARLALRVDGEVVAEAVGRSDAAGSVQATLDVPGALEPGPAELAVGADRFPVRILRTLRVAVVTDRTLYRPTDEVCIRVMVHEASHGAPAAGRKVVLRLGDEERTVETSAHGIASARMHLVEARLGPSQVVAEVEGVTARAAFAVRAFERPTFLVTTEPERLVLHPGESAPVLVRVRAVNGSPRVGAEVTVRSGGGPARSGRTDATGGFGFTVRADPDALRHRVVVTDLDGRMAEHVFVVELEGAEPTLALRPLEEPVVGRPCRCEVVSSTPGPVTITRDDTGEGVRALAVGSEGAAIVEITPSASNTRLRLRGPGAAEAVVRLQACAIPSGTPLLLPDRRVGTVGETLPLSLEGADGPVYVDVLRDGTVLRSLSALLADGRARLDLALTDDLAGVLLLRAWNLAAQGTPRGTTVPVLVTRGRSLSVTTTVAGDTYRPTETACVDVDVLGRDGAPRAAVLGYWGVDEALLALAPWHEAVEEVFDALPAGAGARRLELARGAEHGEASSFGLQQGVLGAVEGHADLHREFAIRHRPGTAAERAVAQARQEIFEAHVRAARDALLRAFSDVPLEELRTAHSLQEVWSRLVSQGALDGDVLRDPWGSALDVHEALERWREVTEEGSGFSSWTWTEGYPCLSAGPDLVCGTSDDVRTVWTPHQVGELPGGMRRLFELLTEIGVGAGMPAGLDAPFWGPAGNLWIGLGGGAGGASWGHGCSRDLGTGGGGRRHSSPVHVRRDLTPTLCFVPEAVVGPGGHARLEIPLKDSITTWRLRLVASDATGATGVGETRVRVSQPLHASPWIAPHLTVGDELELPVAVHNETDEAMEVTVVLGVTPELEVLGPDTARVHVAAHEGAAHVFRYRAVARGAGRVRIDATSTASRDAIERIVTVRPREREVVEVTSGTVSSDQPWTVAFPPLAAGADREHRVSVYPSPLAGTLDGLEGLIACPHG